MEDLSIDGRIKRRFKGTGEVLQLNSRQDKRETFPYPKLAAGGQPHSCPI
jgi:hypothetical protein